jgi:hypothetical protein
MADTTTALALPIHYRDDDPASAHSATTPAPRT